MKTWYNDATTNYNLFRFDLTPGLTGKARCLDKIQKQRKWIEYCERNGVSYEGEKGVAIREADLAELRRCESELPYWTGVENAN